MVEVTEDWSRQAKLSHFAQKTPTFFVRFYYCQRKSPGVPAAWSTSSYSALWVLRGPGAQFLTNEAPGML